MPSTPGLDRVYRTPGSSRDLGHADEIGSARRDATVCFSCLAYTPWPIIARRRRPLETLRLEVGIEGECELDGVLPHQREADLIDERGWPARSSVRGERRPVDSLVYPDGRHDGEQRVHQRPGRLRSKTSAGDGQRLDVHIVVRYQVSRPGQGSEPGRPVNAVGQSLDA